MKEHMVKMHMKQAEHHKKMHAHHTRIAAEHQQMMEHHHDMADTAESTYEDDNNPDGGDEGEQEGRATPGFMHVANR